MWKYLLGWLPMIPIAIANGALREACYARRYGELRAHQLSTLSGVLLLGLYMGVLLRMWPPDSAGQALVIGGLWLVLTLAFEVLFGRYVVHASWSRLLHDYDVRAGRVWIAIPLWLLLAPSVFRWMSS